MQTPSDIEFGSWDFGSDRRTKEKSPELAVLGFVVKPDANHNKRTGRPVRKSAGRRSIAAGFVNWVDAAENGLNEPWLVSTDPADEPDSSDSERPKKKIRTKRFPSPPLPPLSPMMRDDYPTPGSSPPPEAFPEAAPPLALPLTLSFNIPPSFEGGVLNINVDLGPLLQQTNCYKAADLKLPSSSLPTESVYEECFQQTLNHGTGFLDLPGELRNKVYRLAFVTTETIEFNGKGWGRSGAFLATCRTVYEEGRSILYGENKFLIERTNKTRGNYFDDIHKEIGYKDVRRFFESIGPTNIALIRDLSFTFDDAMPSMTPYLSNNEVSTPGSFAVTQFAYLLARNAASLTTFI